MRRFELVFLTFMTATLAACQPVSGKLTVARALAIELIEREKPVTAGCLVRDNDCGEPAVRRVGANFHPGIYEARLNMDASDAFRLWVNEGAAGESELSVTIPDRAQIPREDGGFTVTGEQSGQPFDLSGVVETVKSSSPITAGYESCQQTLKCRFCAYAKPPGKSRKHERKCRYDYVTVYGQRAVAFHNIEKIRMVTLTFTNDSTSDAVADFTGARTRRYKDYVYQGPCQSGFFHVSQDSW